MKKSLKIRETLIIGVLVACIFTELKSVEQKGMRPSAISASFRANFYEHEGKFQNATDYYQQVQNQPENPIYSLRGHVRLLQKKNQHKEILELIDKLDHHFANDPEIQVAIVEALDHTNQHLKAAERIQQLQQKFPGHQKIALYCAQFYLNQRNNEKALATIDAFLTAAPPRPNNFMFHVFKAQIFLAQNRKKDAANALEESLSLYQYSPQTWLLYSVLEEELNHLDNAIKACSRAADLADNPMIRQRLLTLLTKKQGVGEKQTNSSNTCYHKAMMLLERGQVTEALRQIDECLQQQPPSDAARLLKIQILGTMGSIEKALEQLKEWMLAQPENELWFKTASLLRKQGLAKRSLTTAFEAVAKQHPAALLPQLYLADTYLRTHNQQQALTTLNKIITMKIPDQLKAKTYYQMARIYQQQQNSDAMKQALEAGISCMPDFAPIANMLAYYYAGKGHNVSKANELIQKVLAKDPSNPHYLDTAGYIAYKQKEYIKAEKIIEPLATAVPHDTVIERHLHKIQLALTRQNKQQTVAKR